MDDVRVVDTHRAPELVLAEARLARATAAQLHLVVHASTVDTAALVLADVAVDALVAPHERASDEEASEEDPSDGDPSDRGASGHAGPDGGASQDTDDGGQDAAGADATTPAEDVAGRRAALFTDASLAARLRRGLEDLPEDVHGPERPLPGYLLVLRLEGLSPAPRGVADLLERRLHALWSARLAKFDLLVRVDHELAVAVVHGDQLRVDELRDGWGEDAAAFAPNGAPLALRIGLDAPNGSDALLTSALRAADDASGNALAAQPSAVGDELLDHADPVGRPTDPVRRAVLRATSALLATRRGLVADPGRVAAITARDLAAREGLDASETTRLVAAARWHLLRRELVAGECGADVAGLLDAPADTSALHALLGVATLEAARRTAPSRLAA